jgi:hypothetical protein
MSAWHRPADLTLEKGSLIDVSSGAAQFQQGETRGGRGEDVTLIADLETEFTRTADGLLTLDGQIAGFGVSGGGTLKVESGTAISIGGKLLETDGVLKEGESAQADLLLAEDYEVKVGEILPVDYNYSVNIANPGETIGPAGIDRNGQITPAIDWIPPWNGVAYRLIGSLGSIYVNGPGDMQLDNGAKISHIPAGTRIGFPFSGNPFFRGTSCLRTCSPTGCRSFHRLRQ